MLSPFSHVQLFGTLWTVAHHAPLSLGFSRQESWSRLPCPPPGDLSNLGIKLVSLMSSALAGGFFTTRANWDVPCSRYQYFISVHCEIIFYYRDISFCLSIHQLMGIFFFFLLNALFFLQSRLRNGSIKQNLSMAVISEPQMDREGVRKTATLHNDCPPFKSEHNETGLQMACLSDPSSSLSPLIFKNQRGLHLVSHLLADQHLDNLQSKLEAGSWSPAGEDQSFFLHTVLRVAVMTSIHHFVFSKWVC